MPIDPGSALVIENVERAIESLERFLGSRQRRGRRGWPLAVATASNLRVETRAVIVRQQRSALAVGDTRR